MILESNEVCPYKECPYIFVAGITCYGKVKDRGFKFDCKYVKEDGTIIPRKYNFNSNQNYNRGA